MFIYLKIVKWFGLGFGLVLVLFCMIIGVVLWNL